MTKSVQIRPAVKVKTWSADMHKVEYEGQVWHIDVEEYKTPGTSYGELIVRRVHGDITHPLLAEALENLAAERSLILP